MLLEESLHRVWQIIAKPPLASPHESPRLAIIAYGKLGGKELGYSSDLDLVYLHDDPREEAAELYAKLGRRLTSWLSTMTSSGRLYEVDLRLRPDGDAGLLAVSLDAFEQYQFKHAWPWEHQALTRARFAAGNPEVGERFENIRHNILVMPRDAETLATAVRQMREKITAGHPNHSQDFDLKHDRGGMVDLEFVTQYLVLLHAREHTELIKNLGNIALLNLAGQAGLISQDLAKKSGDAYRSLRRRQHELRLQGADKARVPPSELSDERSTIRQLWENVLG
jgi:glutamate-ammonia-ligase adenylyltransferase